MDQRACTKILKKFIELNKYQQSCTIFTMLGFIIYRMYGKEEINNVLHFMENIEGKTLEQLYREIEEGELI